MKTDISGKIALVTGAGRGIGRAIVEALIRAGVYVVATSVNISNLNRLSEEQVGGGGRVKIIPADLYKTEELQHLCDLIKTENLIPDIIVNNAGIFYFEDLVKTTDEMLIKSFAVNVFAPIKICRSFLPFMMEKKWGRIINICSSSSYTGGGGGKHCVYAATKHALLGFSRALDEEVRALNIRVGTVSPAGVKTDMMSNRTDLNPDTFMEPADVAEAVMYQVESEGCGIVYEMRLWRMHR